MRRYGTCRPLVDLTPARRPGIQSEPAPGRCSTVSTCTPPRSDLPTTTIAAVDRSGVTSTANTRFPVILERVSTQASHQATGMT